MKVLFAVAEVAPFSKEGGLADVSGALPLELTRQGPEIEIVSPLYSLIDLERFRIRLTEIQGKVPLGRRSHAYRIAAVSNKTQAPLNIMFVDNKEFYDRSGIYTKPNGRGFPDNNARFFFFQKVVTDLISRGYLKPDIIHVNDHHTGLIPFMLKNRGMSLPSLLTVHNFQYQGHFSEREALLLNKKDQEVLRRNYSPAQGSYNALEIGLSSADRVNTVSLTYAEELLAHEELSFGLLKVLKRIQSRFSGILNGVDYSLWSPEVDPYLETHFDVNHLDGKSENKKNLLKRCGLPIEPHEPLVGSVSRLVDSKGFSLILSVIEEFIALNLRMVFLGTGDRAIQDSLRAVASKYPDRISFCAEFDEKLAHLIEAGSDMFLMPSRFEPCGLNQIYSLRYGTIPIVHKTGGLADTIRDWDGVRGNGFVFENYTGDELLMAVERALAVYGREPQWRKMMKIAMEQDFSWNSSAKEYLRLYGSLLERKSAIES